MSHCCFVVAHVDKSYDSLSPLSHVKGRARRDSVVSNKVGWTEFWIHLLGECENMYLKVVYEHAIWLPK